MVSVKGPESNDRKCLWHMPSLFDWYSIIPYSKSVAFRISILILEDAMAFSFCSLPPSSPPPPLLFLFQLHCWWYITLLFAIICNLPPPRLYFPTMFNSGTYIYMVCFSQQNEGSEVYHIGAESSGAGREFTMYISFSMRPAMFPEEASWSGVRIMRCRVLADLDGYVVWVKNTSFLCRTSKGREILLL